MDATTEVASFKPLEEKGGLVPQTQKTPKLRPFGAGKNPVFTKTDALTIG